MKKRKNYLDYIPVFNDKNKWNEKDGIVTIHMLNSGFYNTIAQKLFNTPRVSHIHLDNYGSLVLKSINGKRTVYEIALLLKDAFGEQAEPLYARLVKYIQILRNNRFIYFTVSDGADIKTVQGSV